MNTVLRNCKFIPELTEGYDKDFGDLLIKDDRIEAIEEPGFDFAGTFEEIDVEGKTVMPGLFELHTHLTLDNTDYDANLLYDDNTLLLKSYAFAKEYLKSGYTTVRDAGCRGNVTVALNNAIKEGILVGPRIISSGQIITPTETGNESFGRMYIEADGCDEVRKACRKQFKAGNDFIKVMGTGAFLNNAGDPGMQIVELEELKECVRTAAMKKSYVAVHAHSDAGVRCAIEAGVRTIEHGSFIEEDTVDLLLKTEGTYLIPTAAIGMECLSEDNENVTADILEKSRKFEVKEKNCVNGAYRKGLMLGFGSDIDFEAFKRVPGYEFIARKEYYDFENLDILKQATINSAKIIGVDDELGTVKAGKLADLIVVDGNPVEDVYVMGKPLVHVFMEGKKINV